MTYATAASTMTATRMMTPTLSLRLVGDSGAAAPGFEWGTLGLFRALLTFRFRLCGTEGTTFLK